MRLRRFFKPEPRRNLDSGSGSLIKRRLPRLLRMSPVP